MGLFPRHGFKIDTKAKAGRMKPIIEYAMALCDDLVSLSESGEERLGKHAPRISAWSVGQQLEHMVNSGHKMLFAVSTCLEHPESNLRERPNWKGRAVLLLKFIPRGIGKAPKPSLPVAVTREEVWEKTKALRDRLAGLEPRLAEIAVCPGRHPQPELGYFSAREHLLMLTIHIRHHLRIIRDIERAVRPKATPTGEA